MLERKGLLTFSATAAYIQHQLNRNRNHVGIFEFSGIRKVRSLNGIEFPSLAEAIEHVRQNVRDLTFIELDADNEAADYFAHGMIYAIERVK